MTQRIVMVDDEEDLVWTLQRQVKRERPDLVFEGFADPEVALERIREQAPDLLITDVRMPKMSGLELILAARTVKPTLPVVVITAYGSPEVQAEVHRSDSVAYLEKPFAFNDLLAAIDASLQRRTGFSGAIQLPMLPDLIQIYALGQTTGMLRIARGAENGAIWFDRGDIVHATSGTLVGPEAVYDLLKWEGGNFSMANEAAPQRSVESSWQELLMEGLRLVDEGRRDADVPDDSPPPGATAAPAVPAGDDVLGADALAELRSQLQGSAPGALLLAGRYQGSPPTVVQGQADAAAWQAAAQELAQIVRKLCGDGDVAAAEFVSATAGVTLAWNVAGNSLCIYGETYEGKGAPSRFRSQAARWAETVQGRLQRVKD